ncbi:MAG: DUF1294 domain-containing protein [Leptolinea sp.]|jgi:uncharacterized membrane protein YsdA (DUF1294 family)|nr:DUF1294 domain-containing protein [Leptolinea sp.]
MSSSGVIHFALVWYGTLSVLLFAMYGLDKAQAVINGRRISERTLHFLALLGGFPGGLLGRALFHHKTRKPFFPVILLGSAGVHILLWFLLLNNFR